MGNSLTKEDINECIKKNIGLIPKKDTQSLYCKKCDKYFYVNNNNNCNLCRFYHKEFCDCKGEFGGLQELNSEYNYYSKENTLFTCINTSMSSLNMTSRMYITDLFKYCEKNNTEITKLNEKIVSLQKTTFYLENDVQNKTNAKISCLEDRICFLEHKITELSAAKVNND